LLQKRGPQHRQSRERLAHLLVTQNPPSKLFYSFVQSIPVAYFQFKLNYITEQKVKTGFEGDRLLMARKRGFETPQMVEREPAIEKSIGMARLPRDGSVIACDRIFVASRCAEQIPDIVMGFRMIWLEHDCPAKARQRLAVALQMNQYVAAVEVRLGQSRTKRDRLVATGQRFLVAPCRA
jgi:hypothetical protein